MKFELDYSIKMQDAFKSTSLFSRTIRRTALKLQLRLAFIGCNLLADVFWLSKDRHCGVEQRGTRTRFLLLNGVSAILASTPDVYWLALPRS